MKTIYALALSTSKDIMRKKIIYFLLIATLIIIFSANLATFFKESIQTRLLKDLVFGMITLFSLCLTIFLSIDLIPSEIETKALYYILSRPVKRWQYIISKTLGLFIILIANIIFIGLAFIIIMYIKKGAVPENSFSALYIITLKILIVASLSVFLSLVTSRLINVSLSVLIYFLLNFIDMIEYFFIKTELTQIKPFFDFLCHFLPKFKYLSFNAQIIHNLNIPWINLAAAGIYSFAWIMLFSGISIVIFSNKDL